MKKWLYRILSWLGDLLAKLFSKKAVEAEGEEAGEEIDKADDHIKDDPVDPREREEDDIFDNKDW